MGENKNELRQKCRKKNNGTLLYTLDNFSYIIEKKHTHTLLLPYSIELRDFQHYFICNEAANFLNYILFLINEDKSCN